MAVDMKKKKMEQSARRAREDQLYSYILSAFGLCILLELFLIALYRTFYTTDAYALEFYLRKFWWLGLLPTAACVVWLVLDRRGKKKRTLPIWGALFFLIGSVMALLMGHYRHQAAKAGCIALPILAVLYCVYLIYQREFFLTALSFGLSILALWLFRRGIGGSAYLLAALAVVLILTLWSALAARWGGRLWKGGPRLFGPRGEWAVLFTAYGVSALCLLGTLLLGAAFAYVAIIALAVLAFVAAVYYTVKIM